MVLAPLRVVVLVHEGSNTPVSSQWSMVSHVSTGAKRQHQPTDVAVGLPVLRTGRLSLPPLEGGQGSRTTEAPCTSGPVWRGDVRTGVER